MSNVVSDISYLLLQDIPIGDLNTESCELSGNLPKKQKVRAPTCTVCSKRIAKKDGTISYNR